MRYVKLLDGGLVDNFGLSGFSIAMLAAQRPFEPMTERQAVKVRRIMFLVVDAGRSISGDFAQRIEGPNGVELVSAAANTAIDASVRSSYAAFSTLLTDWTSKVKRWRCGLSAAERSRLGVGANWRCGDLQRVHRPGEFRPARPGARGHSQRRSDTVRAAGGAGRSLDRRRRRRAAPEPVLSGLSPRTLTIATANFSGLTGASRWAKPKLEAEVIRYPVPEAESP